MESGATALYLDKSARGAQKRKEILETTLAAINAGSITFSDILHDLTAKVRFSKQLTTYHTPQSQLASWAKYKAPTGLLSSRTEFSVLEMSTLEGARLLVDTLSPRSQSFGRIAILNFANPMNPGGGVFSGAPDQEESIAFYSLHQQDDRHGFYRHAMLFSPSIVILRNDAGDWVSPFEVDVLTCAAVNAGKVRTELLHQTDAGALENKINEVMKERMARILFLFEQLGSKNIVLGGFGTGAYRNNVETVARIWEELLVGDKARFARSFHRVVFAILGKDTLNTFKGVFDG
ncbi:hypothetical protein EDB19DRAFT_88810 [Suillus lakei]|nr:hypothetical protein EDB19DRAFT_88810 [Suillus lakei]